MRLWDQPAVGILDGDSKALRARDSYASCGIDGQK
jgi:hypothetical protein